MNTLDWVILLGFLAFILWDGARKGGVTRDVDDYFLAGRRVAWWGVGLSIMATQASAITMIGTTGQGWLDGMRFLQFYYALPLAMLILAVTAVPAYHRLQVTTAYDYLGRRFDRRTRLLSASLFLVQRGLSLGFVISAPALVLAKVLGLSLLTTTLMMGGVAVVYTSIGGLTAVIRTDVKQMFVMTAGLIVAWLTLASRLPSEVGLSGAMTLAAEANRLQFLDLRWDPAEKYTIWSSLFGGLFLFLSYFGADQSQVQRLLAGRSVRESQRALLMNAVCKIPFQLLVLSCGVLLFVFYLFRGAPITFDPERAAMSPETAIIHEQVADDYRRASERLRGAASALVVARHDGRDDEVQTLSARYRELLAVQGGLRERARQLRQSDADTNYVFLEFILTELPQGLRGLLLAAILAAALSSIDSELNSMATVAALDIVQSLRREPLGERALLTVSRLLTLVIGAGATFFALYVVQLGSLIEGVNAVGSLIYGALLGAFILAMVPMANGSGAFFGVIAGVIAVAIAKLTAIAFLWLNVIGAVVAVAVGLLISCYPSRDLARESQGT